MSALLDGPFSCGGHDGAEIRPLDGRHGWTPVTVGFMTTAATAAAALVEQAFQPRCRRQIHHSLVPVVWRAGERYRRRQGRDRAPGGTLEQAGVDPRFTAEISQAQSRQTTWRTSGPRILRRRAGLLSPEDYALRVSDRHHPSRCR